MLAFRVQNLTFGLHISVNTNTREEDQDETRDMMAGKRSVKGYRMEYEELKINVVKDEIQ